MLTRDQLIKSLPTDPAERLQLLRDPWIFLSTCVYTKDEVAKEETVRPFPSHLYYMYDITRKWQNTRLMSIVKSRRMTMTWLMCSLHLHMAITQTDRNIFMASMDETLAINNLKKCKFIYDRIPTDVWPIELLPKINNNRADCLKFDDIGSMITAIPSGADQIRGETASAIMFDEYAFWPKAQETYEAARPATQGGGKMTLLTTPSPGSYAKKIHYDLIDDEKV